jgi:ribosome biogenesis GTPase A
MLSKLSDFANYISAYFKKKEIEIISVHKVFVPAGTPQYTRIDIDSQNHIINNFVNNENEHLLIHGPSKSGKSTLWESQIGKDKVIKIRCIL